MLPHPEIIAASEVGHVLLVDDGKIKLTVTGTLHFRFSLVTFLIYFFLPIYGPSVRSNNVAFCNIL